MGLARTNLGQETAGSEASPEPMPWVSGAFSTTADRFLAVYVSGENLSGGVTPATGLSVADSIGLTWTQRVFAGDAFHFGSIFTAPNPTGGSMTLTIDDSGTFDEGCISVQVFEYAGSHATPIGATLQNVTGGRSDALSLTLSAAPAASSEVLACAWASQFTGGNLVPGAAWTEQFDTFTEQIRHQSMTRAGSTSDAVDWNDLDGVAGSGQLGVEIKAAASADHPAVKRMGGVAFAHSLGRGSW